MEKWILRILVFITILVIIYSIMNNYKINKDFKREHDLSRLRDSISTVNFINESKRIDSLIINNDIQDSLLNIKSINTKVIIKRYEKDYTRISDSLPYLP